MSVEVFYSSRCMKACLQFSLFIIILADENSGRVMQFLVVLQLLVFFISFILICVLFTFCEYNFYMYNCLLYVIVILIRNILGNLACSYFALRTPSLHELMGSVPQRGRHLGPIVHHCVEFNLFYCILSNLYENSPEIITSDIS